MTGLMSALWKPPEDTTSAVKLADYEQTRASGAEEKSQKLAFETTVRIVYRGAASGPQARLHMQSIIASYKQFNTTYLNGFETKQISENTLLVDQYRARVFGKTDMTLKIEEVATMYHLPHTLGTEPNCRTAGQLTDSV
jgi:hypothetical protein